MRKIALAAALALVLLTSFLLGRACGIAHAIRDSRIYAVECYDPDDPSASAWGEYDLRIFITLDGETYVHGMYQG